MRIARVTTCLILVAAASMSLIACGGQSAEEQIVGKWYITNVPRDQAIEATFEEDSSFELYAPWVNRHEYAARGVEATWNLRPVEGSDDLHLIYIEEHNPETEETKSYPLSVVRFKSDDSLLLSTFRAPGTTEATSMNDFDEPPTEWARVVEESET